MEFPLRHHWPSRSQPRKTDAMANRVLVEECHEAGPGGGVVHAAEEEGAMTSTEEIVMAMEEMVMVAMGVVDMDTVVITVRAMMKATVVVMIMVVDMEVVINVVGEVAGHFVVGHRHVALVGEEVAPVEVVMLEDMGEVACEGMVVASEVGTVVAGVATVEGLEEEVLPSRESMMMGKVQLATLSPSVSSSHRSSRSSSMDSSHNNSSPSSNTARHRLGVMSQSTNSRSTLLAKTTAPMTTATPAKSVNNGTKTAMASSGRLPFRSHFFHQLCPFLSASFFYHLFIPRYTFYQVA